MSLEPGASFGGYTIVSKLGEGGMGEVYRATDSRLGRDVAIKVLPDSVAADPDRRARFEREAKALAALNHFNIAQVYGFEGTAIVMELLEGATLRDRLAAGALPLRKALDFGAQMARGLAAAHERGIIHRDLKPENVFVVNDGQIKILDFGLARQAAELLGATATGGGTAPGVVLGTAGYMSPEQVRGQVVDTRSDVFALGALLFEMLTGQRAFRRDSAAETMTAILNDHPSDVSAVRADISPSVDRIVQHCLEKLPAERFQSTRDVAFALEALSGSASAAHAAAARVPARNRERFAWAVLTAALAVATLWAWRAPAPHVSQAPQPVVRTHVLLPPDIMVNDTVFAGSRLSISPDSSQIVGDLDTDETRQLLSSPDLGNMAYASGAIVFARGPSVYAQRFDPSRIELAGEPVMLAAQVQAGANRGAAFAVSGSGLLVYQANDRFDTAQLTWLDRAGRVLSTTGEAADFTNIELSADGRRLLASATDDKTLTRDIYIIDVVRGVRQRFTLDPTEERSAVWSPDQREVIYTSKGLDLYRRAADLSGDEKPVIVDADSKDPYDWSPDGRSLLYRRSGTGTGNDLWLHSFGGGPDRPVAVTRFSEVGGNFSHDGKWILYVSDESGQYEVYATRVDGGGKIQISSGGGTFPRWRGDGREIVYLGSDRFLMSAMVERTAPSLEVSAPKRLFTLDVDAAPGAVYDVTADGSRFIVASRVPSRVTPSLTVLHNWPRLLPPASSRP